MDAFSILRHLERVHTEGGVRSLDAQDCNRLHHRLHRCPQAHAHCWNGYVADPQPPMRERTP